VESGDGVMTSKLSRKVVGTCISDWKITEGVSRSTRQTWKRCRSLKTLWGGQTLWGDARCGDV